MDWFIAALVAPFFLSLVNVVDQFVVRKDFPGDGKVFLFLGSFSYLFISPLIFLFFPEVLNIDFKLAIFLVGMGMLGIFSVVPYFLALDRDDITMVMPISQLVPIIVFAIAYFVFSETVEFYILVGALLITIGAMFITFDFNKREVRFKTFLLMLLFSVGFALFTILIRFFAVDIEWFVVSFWMSIGFLTASSLVFSLMKSYRVKAIEVLIKTRFSVLIIASIQEVFYFIAMVLTVITLSKAPSTGVVQSLLSLNMGYILILSAIFSYFYPDQFEKLGIGKIFWWRLGCIVVMFVGVYLIHNGN